MKKALITGITGQDGSYLAELLLDKGYEVHGIIRRSSTFNTGRIDHIYQDPHLPRRRLFLHYGDLTDGSSLNLILETRPARRDLQPRRAEPRPGLLRRAGVHRRGHRARHAAAARGDPRASGSRTPASTRRPRRRCSAAVAAAAERDDAVPPAQPLRRAPRSTPTGSRVNYREAYGMHVSNGILFNHESPRRGETFVTRKITRAAAASSSACRRSSTSATWTRSATGATPRTTSRRCGSCSSSRARRLRRRHRARPTRSASCASVAFGHVGLDYQRVRGDRPALLPADRGGLPARATRPRRASSSGWKPKDELRRAGRGS